MKFKRILTVSATLASLVGIYKLLPFLSSEYQLRVPRIVELHRGEQNLTYNTYPSIDYRFTESGLQITCTDADGIDAVGTWDVFLTNNRAPYRYLDGWALNSNRLTRESREEVKLSFPNLPQDKKIWFKEGSQHLADNWNLEYHIHLSYNDGHGLIEKVAVDIPLE